MLKDCKIKPKNYKYIVYKKEYANQLPGFRYHKDDVINKSDGHAVFDNNTHITASNRFCLIVYPGDYLIYHEDGYIECLTMEDFYRRYDPYHDCNRIWP